MNGTIDQHISNLLYQHECVVVKDFGAFLTRYFPAEVNAATHMFRPPSRRVAFNGSIRENDGLLAKHIATVEGVSYEQALQSIEISVRSWQRILRSGKKVNLHRVGRLFLDEAGQLQFNPAHDINYHIQSYGLNIFRATPMEREQKIKKSVNRAIENKKSSNKNPTTARKNYLRWAAILGPAVAIILVGSYFYTQERESFDQAAGYVTSWFDGSSSEESEDAEASMLDSVNTSDNSNSEQNISYEDAVDEDGQELYNVKNREGIDNGGDYNESSGNSSTGPMVDMPEESSSPSLSERVEGGHSGSYSSRESGSSAGSGENSNLLQPDYQIVVGSFSESTNAQEYIEALQRRGYDAYDAGRFGMFSRVAVGRLQSENEAQQMLEDVRHQVNHEAWLNKNK